MLTTRSAYSDIISNVWEDISIAQFVEVYLREVRVCREIRESVHGGTQPSKSLVLVFAVLAALKPPAEVDALTETFANESSGSLAYTLVSDVVLHACISIDLQLNLLNRWSEAWIVTLCVVRVSFCRVRWVSTTSQSTNLWGCRCALLANTRPIAHQSLQIRPSHSRKPRRT